MEVGIDYKGAAQGILQVEFCLFYILTVVIMRAICICQSSLNCTAEGINFTVCKLYINNNSITNHNIVPKRKQGQLHDEYKDIRESWSKV